MGLSSRRSARTKSTPELIAHISHICWLESASAFPREINSADKNIPIPTPEKSTGAPLGCFICCSSQREAAISVTALSNPAIPRTTIIAKGETRNASKARHTSVNSAESRLSHLASAGLAFASSSAPAR